MRIALENIPKPGRTVRFGFDQPVDVQTVAEALDAQVVALEGSMRVERGRADVTAFVKGHADAVRPCDRCGDDVSFRVDVDTSLVYRTPTNIPSGEYELEEKELDVGFLEEDAVVTEHVLSEAFALDAPDRVTCAGDSCAVPESAGAQAVTDDVVPNPFAALKDLF